MFGNTPAVGRHFSAAARRSIEVIGVVEDGKYESLTEDPTPAMFFPLAQNNRGRYRPCGPLAVAAGRGSSRAQPRCSPGVDPSLPFTLHSWSDALALVLFPARVATAALGVMGLLAAMLAVTGVFGMAAYSVSKRLKEFGIRVALGAQPHTTDARGAGPSAAPVALRLVLGLLLGMVASGLLAQLIYQATPRDPLVLAGAVVTMTLVGLVATWIPARRALAVDPAQLLRDE